MPLKIKVYNQNVEPVGEIELSPGVFGVKSNPALVHQAAVAQMANQRKVIAHTKTRSEVRGGGRKPWAQKGTGRARHGSSRSPIWRGGGVTFGPRNDRNFKVRINKKMKQNALLMALSDKAANNNLAVVDKFSLPEFKTKFFHQIIAGFEDKVFTLLKAPLPKPESGGEEHEPAAGKTKTKTAKRSLLIVVDGGDEKLVYSSRNLPGVELINLDNINILGILKYRNLIMTKEAVEKAEERYKK